MCNSTVLRKLTVRDLYSAYHIGNLFSHESDTTQYIFNLLTVPLFEGFLIFPLSLLQEVSAFL